ncbi:DUF2812 domain-containing protein [Paenalkalicoccus suaedae]|uniref:DUF2812 domain-containing protein n=1 Tax=Paenalkalicoccus suaedae TaxID=2592382 RepID=A0A859FCJ8_9BACI|nr:DUF2812 domain-containing protein [Paenalkalicoccus suaedae]QKS69936.1 DUF2812 domain-containing protein [Paenalkalicoccus suaedae]
MKEGNRAGSVTKWLWSFHVQQTERWLEDMSNKGYRLRAFDRRRRRFYFDEQPSERATYRVVYGNQFALATSMRENGWRTAAESGKWHIVRSTKPREERLTEVVRDPLITRNERILNIWAFYFTMVFILTLMQISLFLIGLSGDSTIQVITSPMWSVTFLFFFAQVALFLFGLYSFFILRRENRELKLFDQESDPSMLVEDPSLTVKKWRFQFWLHPKAGEKMCIWLEEQERAGLKLRWVDRQGMRFVFKRSEPKEASYYMDKGSNYGAAHHEMGWELIYFTGNSSPYLWKLYRTYYNPTTEEKPIFYSDKASELYAVKRKVRYQIMISAMIIGIQLINIPPQVSRAIRDGEITGYHLFFFPLVGFAILLCSWFIISGLFYYFSQKRALGGR